MAQLDWLDAAGTALNADPEFRRLGSTDLVLGLKSGKAVRVVTFEAFEVASVREADETALRDCELVIEMTPRQWTDYLKRRAVGRGQSLVGLDVDRNIVSARRSAQAAEVRTLPPVVAGLGRQGCKRPVAPQSRPRRFASLCPGVRLRPSHADLVVALPTLAVALPSGRPYRRFRFLWQRDGTASERSAV